MVNDIVVKNIPSAKRNRSGGGADSITAPGMARKDTQSSGFDDINAAARR